MDLGEEFVYSRVYPYVYTALAVIKFVLWVGAIVFLALYIKSWYITDLSTTPQLDAGALLELAHCLILLGVINGATPKSWHKISLRYLIPHRLDYLRWKVEETERGKN